LLDQGTYDENTEPMLSHINVGSGSDCTIRELAEIMKKVVGFEGEIVFDTTKPDGAPRKLMDVERLKKLGWEAGIGLEEGLGGVYGWFCEKECVT
jgi:GDP-L-fucose synthase